MSTTRVFNRLFCVTGGIVRVWCVYIRAMTAWFKKRRDESTEKRNNFNYIATCFLLIFFRKIAMKT